MPSKNMLSGAKPHRIDLLYHKEREIAREKRIIFAYIDKEYG